MVEKPPTGHGEPPPKPEFPLTVVAEDDVDEAFRGRARVAVERVAASAHRPVVRAQVSLRLLEDPALALPAVVKATIHLQHRPVRAHVAAPTLGEAIDAVEHRLRRNLERLEERSRSRRHETGAAEPGEWRHGDLPTSRPEHFLRPAEERELVRRKTFASAPTHAEQAVLEMLTLDHDFHLFTDNANGEERVVYRENGGVAEAGPPPVLLLEEAMERLDAGGERFVFFVDAQTRRGNLLYVRYDGNYGLVEPVD